MSRVALQTLIDRSFRNMKAVHPAVKDKIHLLLIKCYRDGINVQISSGYRSNTEQQRIYNQGRTTAGSVVTNAKPGQSVHNYGLAVDYFLTNWDGTDATWTVNKDWRSVAEFGKALRFNWGGDWKNFRDYAHLELTDGLSWRDLKAGRRPRDVVLNEGPPQQGHSGYDTYRLQIALRDIGYNLEADGFFGSSTDSVLKQFQREHGLEVDGLYGMDSMRKMKDVMNRNSAAGREPKEELTVVRDNNEPSDWAKKDWEEAKENGYFIGKRPKENMTREEVAVVVNRLRQNFLTLIEENKKEIRDLREEIDRLSN
ncbi:D-alanyl-D-alanine carboxypeptidase family protein [Halobacillus salinus]|uniref:Peptidase M15 n=1 Tax=Halobacillus salinus TaxID=192814 RepID=A0A4Z0H2S5_9BACI|nr:D-alanyl-D-alanine carboxypeptidase family protein [Halobacillus salinus]TGB04672.1 peptidase M15 [Halobacillus salinus]